MSNKNNVFWTVKHNWNGYLWPRTWPNEAHAWREVEKENGKTKAEIKATHDWSIVPIRLVEAKP
ncbi:hypothetical protein [Pararobbsia silviterrae]|nr:hypothetical protein [Pararobbsia silviterrae]